MARNRIKDKSDFSCLLKFPERLRPIALKILKFVTMLSPTAKVTEYEAEDNQKYTYILIQLA